ncbi:hypothetical protein Tco_0994537, partial [Tanacetum coccineum]
VIQGMLAVRVLIGVRTMEEIGAKVLYGASMGHLYRPWNLHVEHVTNRRFWRFVEDEWVGKWAIIGW